MSPFGCPSSVHTSTNALRRLSADRTSRFKQVLFLLLPSKPITIPLLFLSKYCSLTPDVSPFTLFPTIKQSASSCC